MTVTKGMYPLTSLTVLLTIFVCGCVSAPSAHIIVPSMSTSPPLHRQQYAHELLRVIGRAAPEQVGYLGVEGFEDAVVDVSVDSDERDVRELEAAAARFAVARGGEPERESRTDLVILEDAARRLAERTRLSTLLMVRVPDVAQL